MAAKRRKGKTFKKFLIIYSAVLAFLCIIVWGILYNFIGDYEKGRPSSTMDTLAARFSADNIENLLNESGVVVNEFESNEMVAEYLKDKLNNEKVSYKKKAREYSEETPVYIVFAGETPIAKVSLDKDGQGFWGFNKWKLGQISFDDFADKTTNNAITVSVPKGSTVTINGVEVKDDYIKEDDIEFEPCKHVSDYVNQPLRTTYEISGLIIQPDIKVHFNENDLTVEVSKNTYTANYPSDDELLESVHEDIMTLGRNYGKYIINRGSLSSLTNQMVGYAKDYMSDIPAVWAFLYGMTYTYEFQNENISNFVKYSDDCFSCDVYYDLYVQWNGGDKTYNTSLTYTYVKIDGKWVVADFIIN